MRINQYKADLEDLAEHYLDARDEEFNNQFKDFILEDIHKKVILTEDDIQGFLDSFTFPPEEEWVVDEYESRRDSYEDAKYEEERDRRAGL